MKDKNGEDVPEEEEKWAAGLAGWATTGLFICAASVGLGITGVILVGLWKLGMLIVGGF